MSCANRTVTVFSDSLSALRSVVGPWYLPTEKFSGRQTPPPCP